MQIALNSEGDRICASDANKGKDYFCPLCHGKVIPKKGQINIDHFAHVNKCEDTWHYDMSEWHYQWQNQFPRKNQEVVVEYNGEKHRADVMAYGFVIEFQHSTISAEEFDKRNQFYLGYGKRVIWIFDCIDEFDFQKMECYDDCDNGGKFKWKHPKRFMQNYLPQRDKDIIVFFQLSEADFSDTEAGYLERVVWAIDEGGFSNFKKFSTSYYYAGNIFELIEWLKSEWRKNKNNTKAQK